MNETIEDELMVLETKWRDKDLRSVDEIISAYELRAMALNEELADE
jgi:hypothetical protein